MDVTSVNININSEDPDRLTAFYRDTVGFRADERSGGLHIREGIQLFIASHSEVSGPTKEPPRVLFNFFVDDLKAEQARLEAAGVPFIRKEGVEWWGGIISTFVDPDGNYCQLMEFTSPTEG